MSIFRGRIDPSGRLVIPAAQRKALGLEAGDEVLMKVEGEELRISSLRSAIKRAQTLVRRYNPTGESLSESLIRDRRAEARDG